MRLFLAKVNALSAPQGSAGVWNWKPWVFLVAWCQHRLGVREKLPCVSYSLRCLLALVEIFTPT